MHPSKRCNIQDNNLIFTWTADFSYEHRRDHVMLTYVPALNKATYNLCGAKRSTSNDVLVLPDNTGKEKQFLLIFYINLILSDSN